MHEIRQSHRQAKHSGSAKPDVRDKISCQHPDINFNACIINDRNKFLLNTDNANLWFHI